MTPLFSALFVSMLDPLAARHATRRWLLLFFVCLTKDGDLDVGCLRPCSPIDVSGVVLSMPKSFQRSNECNPITVITVVVLLLHVLI